MSSILFATALADAHGLPVENLGPKRIARLFPKGLPPLVLLGGRGLMSDDTEHAAITARAFALSGGEPEKFETELAKGLRRWFWALPPTTGMATAKALVRLSVGITPKNSGVDSAGNGACMRAPVLGLLVDEVDRLWDLTLRSSRMTHRDPRAIHGAFLLALWVQMSRLKGSPVSIGELLRYASTDLVSTSSPLRSALEEVDRSLSQGESTADFAQKKGWKKGPTGFVMHTVPAAFHVLLGPSETWEEAVRGAVMLGGDTDSIAALVGAMRSVIPGQYLPSAWLEQWKDWPRSEKWMETVEESAKKAARTGQPIQAPDVSWWACLIRNVVMWVRVLGHGVRRLLPPYWSLTIGLPVLS